MARRLNLRCSWMPVESGVGKLSHLEPRSLSRFGFFLQ
jgi:hypothetical protein